jgi:acetyltransferase
LGVENLGKIFNPKSIAVIGASDRKGSVGYKLLNNLISAGYKGIVYPVNPGKEMIQGISAYSSMKDLPDKPDLAVIAVRAALVPEIVEECGGAGTLGLIIVSAGFKEIGAEGRKLEEEILQKKQKYGLRIIGPNCLGAMRPAVKLNATFTNRMALPGNIAFISQSGALCTSILDWAVASHVGFSAFVSIGDMLDVDFGDLIDYFGMDVDTRSIVLYVESITDARKFMSAARGFARTKPIIVVKSGRFKESAKAAVSHTGALAGEDNIYEAAFRRAGMVRVDEIDDLFNSSEVLAKQPLPKGPGLAIIANAGGPAVMATDALISGGGTLANLSDETINELNEALPPHWSKSNPVDVLGDATTDRFRKSVEICLKDRNVDGVLIIYTPQGAADPVETAKVVAEISKSTRKPILTSWMGETDVRDARNVLSENGIPAYRTPEQAVRTYMYMYEYSRDLSLLYETPEEFPVDMSPPKYHVKALMRTIAKEGRETLTESESKRVLKVYSIPVVKTHVATTPEAASAVASRIGYPVVMKILSPQITHKSDVGGVVLDIKSDSEAGNRFNEVIERVKTKGPSAKIEGVTIQRMVENPDFELIIGSKRDPLFGSVILFGMGGIGVEVFQDRVVGFPPLNQVLARRLMERTKVYRVLKSGYRNKPPANLSLLEEILVKFSHLIIDFPEIKEMDVNPIVVKGNEVLALDARIIIDRDLALSKPEGYQHLIISPYPTKYVTELRTRDNRRVVLRPIKPEDEPLWLEMFKNFSKETIMQRFFYIIKDTPHDVRVRYCNIDYDREIAIVADLTENNQKKIAGVVRLVIDPDGRKGEFAVVVADPWQRLGLGSKMIDYIIGIAEDKNLETIYGIVLRENSRMIDLVERLGFHVEYRGSEALVTLKLR